MNRLLTLFLSTLCLLAHGFAQQPGTIAGTVMDEVGKPLTGAHVIVDPADGRPRSSGLLIVETDKSGHFSIDSLALGTYKVFAKKDSAGYPDTSFAFYSNQVFATATLTRDAPIVNLMLKVGPVAGTMTGVVTGVRKDPISATFMLRRAADPNNWISMSQRPEYRILLPPGTDILLEVSAPGYKTWYWGGPSDSLGRPPIRLESRTEMKLDIQLQPEKKEGNQQ
jgi:hypothetical protein